ncbi:MAG: hypothetical protein IJ644_08275 [Oscillospiraceae bacterium]|nr:hypothetical protein [Oscillospiraceae bacterium]
MEDYKHLYYALFNRISDLISETEQKSFTSEQMLKNLKALQTEAEERFIKSSEKMSEYECFQKQCSIYSGRLLELVMDCRYEYEDSPKAMKLLGEIQKIRDEADEVFIEYFEQHKDEIKILHCR